MDQKAKMEMFRVLQICLLISICSGDFFRDLDKMGDVDAQLLEIDKMMKNIDTNADDALRKLNGEKKQPDVLDGLANSLGDLLSGDCGFSCPNGAVPRAKKGHMPSTNGCGSFGMNIELDGLPEMTSCCDVHDRCYDTCNSNKEQCDTDFKKCLLKMCKSLRSTLTKEEYDGCKSTGELMHTGTVALGCSAYKDAQKNACTCDGPTDKSSSKSTNKQPTGNADKPSVTVPKGKKAQHAERVQQKKEDMAEREKKRKQEEKLNQSKNEDKSSGKKNRKVKREVKDEL